MPLPHLHAGKTQILLLIDPCVYCNQAARVQSKFQRSSWAGPIPSSSTARLSQVALLEVPCMYYMNLFLPL